MFKWYLNEALCTVRAPRQAVQALHPTNGKCRSMDRSSFRAMSDHLIQPTQNLSFVLEKVQSLRFEDRPIPQIRDDDDVLVRVKFTEICGSDVSSSILVFILNQSDAG